MDKSPIKVSTSHVAGSALDSATKVFPKLRHQTFMQSGEAFEMGDKLWEKPVAIGLKQPLHHIPGKIGLLCLGTH